MDPPENRPIPNGLPASPLDAAFDAAEPGLGGAEGSYVPPGLKDRGGENPFAETTPSEASVAAGPSQGSASEGSSHPSASSIPAPWLAVDEEQV